MDIATNRTDINQAAQPLRPRMGHKGTVTRRLDDLARTPDLPDDEHVRALTVVYTTATPSLIVLTDRRLLHYLSFRSVHWDIGVNSIAAATWVGSGARGDINIATHGGQDYVAPIVDKNEATILINRIRERMDQPTTPAEHPVDRLIKLADLHRAGLLDDDEYAAAKTLLLRNP